MVPAAFIHGFGSNFWWTSEYPPSLDGSAIIRRSLAESITTQTINAGQLLRLLQVSNRAINLRDQELLSLGLIVRSLFGEIDCRINILLRPH